MKGTGAKAPAERSRALCGEVALMVGKRERRARAISAAFGRKSARQGIGAKWREQQRDAPSVRE